MLGEFKKYLVLCNFSPCTIRAYISDVLHYLKSLQSPEEYFHSLKVCPNSKVRKLSALKHFYKWRISKGQVTKNPFESIPRPKVPRRIPKYIKQEEVQSLSERAKTLRNKLIVLLLFESGLRISELSFLLIENIFIQEGFIKVFGKGSKERFTPISSLTLTSMLTEFIGERTHGFLLPGRKGKSLTAAAIRKVIRKLTDKEYSPHAFRHGFGTFMTQNGVPLQVIQEIMGHASINTTAGYSHVSNRTLSSYHKKCFSNP